jgi:excisionase family DNA binding protein
VDDLLPVADVALILAVSTKKVYKMCDSGELRSAKIGRCRRVSRASVNAYLAARFAESETGRKMKERKEESTQRPAAKRRTRGARKGYQHVR